MTRKIVYSIIVLAILCDGVYSFQQHLSHPLDGDIAWNIVPDQAVEKVLSSPLGGEAILKNQTYANPNRFFCHWVYREYLRGMPLFLQHFFSPIDSVYVACALAKIGIQILLIYLLAALTTGISNFLRFKFLLVSFLLIPLFQTNGYANYMGIIDPSITFTFFYALPIVYLLLYFSPFIRQNYHHKLQKTPIYVKIFWLPLAIVVSLSGPLNPGIALIFSLLVLTHKFTSNYRNSKQTNLIQKGKHALFSIPENYWFYLVPITALSVYSLWLGTYNNITIENQISLSEMYRRLPTGIYYQFTQKPGFPILFLILGLNYVLIRTKINSPAGTKIYDTFKWIAIFAGCYILLLPLGGYREYRHNILRYDTILPITLALFLAFGQSSIFLLQRLSTQQKKWYVPILILVLLIFTNSDRAEFDKNHCEKRSLQKIANSKEAIVQLNHNCSIMAWGKTTAPEHSELNARLLVIWGVSSEKKLFYNE